MTAQCPLDALPQLFDTPNLDGVMAPGSCHLLMDSSTVNVAGAGIHTLHNERPLVGRVGAGVIVGIVDTGIDVTHPDFLRVSGNTRLVGYWNQTRTISGKIPAGFAIGTEWLPDDINSGQIDVWASDSIGHGTHVAGIAAGNGDAANPCLRGSGPYQYTGIAPEADLCVVKAFAKSDYRKISTLQTRIINGVDYIFRKAQSLSKPAVVNLSLGSHYGPHNGRSMLDYSIDGFTGPGKIVVAAAGNDANTGIHGSIQLHANAPQEMSFEIGPYTSGIPSGKYLILKGWHHESDSVKVSVITPSDSTFGPGPSIATTQDGRIRIETDPGECMHLPNQTCSPEDGFIVVIDDLGSTGAAIRPGGWRLRLEATSIGATGRVDVYLVEADLGGANTPLIQFVLGDTSRTITSPATADEVIAVGGYATKTCWRDAIGQEHCPSHAEREGDILYFSSRGPRRDGVVKPDIAAPGAMIVASKSSSSPVTAEVVAGGNYVALAGTSMAAPHVTGAVALILGRTDTHPDSLGGRATPAQIRSRLQASARRDSLTGSAISNRWGAGKLDIRGALAPVMGIRFTEPRRGTIVDSHWGQLSIMADSATTGNAFDSVVVYLALDGCTYSQRIATFTNIIFTNRSYGMLYFAPEAYRTSEAKLLATGYRGANRVQVESDGVFAFNFGSPTSVESAPARKFTLYPNAPNPFNPSTIIRFETAVEGPLIVRIYSVDGRVVRTIIDQTLPMSRYEVVWNGCNDRDEPVASGIYLVEVRSAGNRLMRKLSLLK